MTYPRHPCKILLTEQGREKTLPQEVILRVTTGEEQRNNNEARHTSDPNMDVMLPKNEHSCSLDIGIKMNSIDKVSSTWLNDYPI